MWRAIDGDDAFAPLTGEVIPATGAGDYRFAESVDTLVGGTYLYRLTERSSAGGEFTLGEVRVVVPGAPRALLLEARPNPFNPSTALRFALPADVTVDLAVFDALGRRVRSLLLSEPMNAGTHVVRWDGRDDSGARSASSVYFAWLRAGDQSRKVRLVLLQ